MNTSPLLDAVDSIEIIHLPERVDRHAQLIGELRRLGMDPDDPRIRIPYAPKPADPHGFPSRGVYGNFLSHLDILRRARDRNAARMMVLEDDAIFRSRLRNPDFQSQIVSELHEPGWGMCFLGHSLRLPRPSQSRLFIESTEHFRWAHCYIVNGPCLGPLVAYLEAVIERPRGHPLGGQMYIDGAFCLFRDQHPNLRTLVANPVLSNQRGSPSSLGTRHWFHHLPMVGSMARFARDVRDELWRRSGINVAVHRH
jgi:glycosyl transferase family 25